MLSEVRLNEPLPADAFRIPNLAGLRCVDKIRKEEYRLDENGEPAGPVWPEGQDEPDGDEPHMRVTRIALYALAGLAAPARVIGAILIHRRRRPSERRLQP